MIVCQEELFFAFAMVMDQRGTKSSHFWKISFQDWYNKILLVAKPSM